MIQRYTYNHEDVLRDKMKANESKSYDLDQNKYTAFVAYGDTANPTNFIIVYCYVQHEGRGG